MDLKNKRHDMIKVILALFLSQQTEDVIVTFFNIYKSLQEKDKIYEDSFLTFEVLSIIQHFLYYKQHYDSFTFYSFLKTFKKSILHKNLNVRLICLDLLQKFMYSIEDYKERDYQMIRKSLYDSLKSCHKEDNQTIMESFKSLFLFFNFYQSVSIKNN